MMQLPQIRLEQTYIQMGLNIRKPVQEIEQPKAELNMRQEPAIVEIEYPYNHIQIDSSRAKRQIGIRTQSEFSDYNASFAKEKLLEAIGRISSEGDRLMAIETGENAIANIAAERYLETTPDIPPAGHDEGVDISYPYQPIRIDVQRRGFSMDPVIRPPILKYTPGKVEGHIRQWNRVDIDFVGLFVDQKR
jgi:hypothetical protein